MTTEEILAYALGEQESQHDPNNPAASAPPRRDAAARYQ